MRPGHCWHSAPLAKPHPLTRSRCPRAAPSWLRRRDSGQPWRSPYPFGPHKHKTSKWLRVARGYSERGMPLAQVGNGRVLRRSLGRGNVARVVMQHMHTDQGSMPQDAAACVFLTSLPPLAW